MATLNREYFQRILQGADPSSMVGSNLKPGDDFYVAPSAGDVAWKQKQVEAAKNSLALLDQYGVNDLTELPNQIRDQLPNRGVYHSGSGKTVLDNFVDFFSNPGVWVALGGAAGVVAGGAGAAGAAGAEGAGTGAAAGTTAGTGSALGSGVTATAAEGGLGAGLGTTTAGQTGLTLGQTTGAVGGGALGGGVGTGAGSATGGALGTGSALAPGYFSSEGVAAGGGASVGAPPSGGESSLLPQGMSLTDLAVKAAPAALGMYGSDKQADAYSGLAGQYMQMGEPYRQRLSDLYNDPSSFLNSAEVQLPVQQGTNILARSLSTQGNPAGSGNALQELQSYATNQMMSRLGQERDRLAGFGGLTQYAAAAPAVSMSGIGARKGVYDALGAGIADVFGGQPKYNLEDLYRTYYA